MSTAELLAIVEQLAVSQQETDRRQKETDRQLKELGKQIGGLGNKFGSFAEGMAYQSIKRILRDEFEIDDFVAPGILLRRDGKVEEYDVLAYSNGGKGMIVEIKSKLEDKHVEQMDRKMAEVFDWLPAHRGKKFYGMIAYVSGPEAIKRRIMKNGWFLAHIGDDLFHLENPPTFNPRVYQVEVG